MVDVTRLARHVNVVGDYFILRDVFAWMYKEPQDMCGVWVLSGGDWYWYSVVMLEIILL